MLDGMNNKNLFKTIMRFIPIETILNVFKYSKYYLNLLGMNHKCLKYYHKLKALSEKNFELLLDKNTICYTIKDDFFFGAPNYKEDSNCIQAIRNFIVKQKLAKKMELGIDEEDGDKNQILNYQHWNLYKGQLFVLYVCSNSNISEEEKNFLLKKLKKEKTNIYIVIDKKGKNKNNFIDWLFKNWKESIYSLIFLEDIEDRNILFKKILEKADANSIRELKINFDINDKEKILLFKNFLPNCSNLKTLTLNTYPGEKEGYGIF